MLDAQPFRSLNKTKLAALAQQQRSTERATQQLMLKMVNAGPNATQLIAECEQDALVAVDNMVRMLVRDLAASDGEPDPKSEEGGERSGNRRIKHP